MKRSILILTLICFGCINPEFPPWEAPTDTVGEPPAEEVATRANETNARPMAGTDARGHESQEVESPWAGFFRRHRPDPYALDDLPRWVERDERGRLQCPEIERERYPGEVVKYHRPIEVNADFRERLKRFETIVADVATEVYGRAPTRIVHFGAYNCRTIRHRKSRYSEHAFGNAIDVAEFRFGALPREERKAAGELGRRFRVNVKRHWDGDSGVGKTHAEFLKTMVRTLREDRVFRGMIVPPAPGHHNHLHLDMGRWHYLRGDVTLPSDDVL